MHWIHPSEKDPDHFVDFNKMAACGQPPEDAP